jgi:hypothetical protein
LLRIIAGAQRSLSPILLKNRDFDANHSHAVFQIRSSPN